MGKSREFQTTLPVTLLLFNDTLHTPKAFKDQKTGKEKGDPKYQATFLIDPSNPDLEAMKALTREIAKENNVTDFKEIVWPFKNGDKEADRLKAKTPPKNGEYLRGKVFIRTDSLNPPALGVFKDGDPKKGLIECNDPILLSRLKPQFYSGVQVIAVINFSYYAAVKEGDKPGIKAYLNGVVSFNKGERLGRKSLAERFKGYAGAAVDTNPTEGDDEIPF